tara:strand:- start:1042 stop:1233 length:192 start_codon:yes stop_codon:yes gene_type:complete
MFNTNEIAAQPPSKSLLTLSVGDKHHSGMDHYSMRADIIALLPFSAVSTGKTSELLARGDGGT